ncbi:kinase-like domain-containing protein [Xylariaceae sp. FL0662B]|nr:kinase-like domain-containing protein [Xylariaceae sp. FL0662B]
MDTDLIARIYPYHDPFYHAQIAILASSRSMPPRLPPRSQQQDLYSRSSRESTEPLEEYNLDTLPYIELRFSSPPRTSSGLVFGTDQDICDVVLPNTKGMGLSKRHFALTYKRTKADGQYHLIIKDLESTNGTIVTYDDRGSKRRSKFEWIVDGFEVPNITDNLIVRLHETISFKIIVTHHNITSPAYIDNVERFRQGAANLQDLVGGFGLQSGPDTKRNSGAQTPVKRPILLPQGIIGHGGSGIVSCFWDVSTGEVYACKRPVAEKYDKEAWRKEIAVMRKISDNHIIRLRFAKETPHPRMYLEYMPFGNLEYQHSSDRFSHGECVAILHQGTSALKYLHGQREPIAHRDIKPENILVKYRDPGRNPDDLCIKLSDFGLAKIGDSLQTDCGSETYCPPEIWLSRLQQTYTKAVDIWSLGVVILRFAYALPPPGSGKRMRWCHKVVEEVNSRDSDGLVDLLQRMLVINAEARCSAADCYREASQLLLFSEDRSATPTPASYATGHGVRAAHPASVEQGGEEETLRILPYEVCNLIS